MPAGEMLMGLEIALYLLLSTARLVPYVVMQITRTEAQMH
jgi:hypothetical protein